MTISEIRRPAGEAVPSAAQHPEEHAVESWHRREPPLPAVAVLGVGAVATALAAATHRRLADGAALRTVADPEYLVVLGEEDALPWVDGARYLGWDGAALTLTTHQVLPSADLWRSTALAARGTDFAADRTGTADQADAVDGAAQPDQAGQARRSYHSGQSDHSDEPDQATLVIVLPEQVLIAADTIADADPAALAELFAA